MEKITNFLKDRRQLGAWAGIIGPLLFITIFTIEGFLRPGYNMVSMYISELSFGPRGWIQIINFIITGVLLLLFARAITTEFPEGKASRAGPILFYIIAIFLLSSGPLVMDPRNTPVDQLTWHGIIHGILGALVFVIFAIICFVYLRRFREDPKWESYKWWTLVSGLIITVAIVLLSVADKMTIPNIFTPPAGIIQRMIIIPAMIWIFSLALKLSKEN